MRRNTLFIFTWDKSLFFSSRAANNKIGIDTLILDFKVMGRNFHA